jgi:A/G-specific adenine glycosylase
VTDLATIATDWYRQHARDLPWREPGTSAWAILVSEVMLQQTPVNRVVPVWCEWVRRWPAPAGLAADSTADAIRAWGRLGYPRRAMRLHACATAIVERHNGLVPDQVSDLLALPGIGTYTAHAIAAFAYRQRHPVVDTNVRRVIARVVSGEPDSGSVTTAADLRLVHAQLPDDPELAAQASAAYMEIGAVLCTARTPRCLECPLQTTCLWRAAGTPLPAQPSRRRQAYAGTERQIRGALLAVLRDSDHPVARTRLDLAWPDANRRQSALASLLADGLVVEVADQLFALGGHVDGARAE